MPDTGAPWNIPYVEAADLVSDWPADSLALANATAAALSSITGGKIQQVVQATDTTDRTTTSATSVDASISLSITPTDATSTIYVFWNAEFGANRGAGGYSGTEASITDSSDAELTGAESTPVVLKHDNSNWAPAYQVATLIGSVSAASTSARTYKGRFRLSFTTSGSPTAYIANATKTGLMFAVEVLP
jgi:hypothetical protein